MQNYIAKILIKNYLFNRVFEKYENTLKPDFEKVSFITC